MLITSVTQDIPLLSVAAIVLGLTGLAIYALVAGVEWAERRLRIRRAARAYRKHVEELERRQFMTEADFARVMGPYARRTDHRVVSIQDRRPS